ncbi:hypothetical protein JL107_02260 [Nakamurella flavida]|uniref:DUF4267 domain-containing protein n=1 Tax=Nakamurella flavida TaxID=363630 RepID=A0A939C433_9ACTN|nr:hypothetical protein [Nakamurella flavida]MBM9475259.1 hypothetical protein [Nakamurella flavida]MDP9776833.1 hypothetical protein [Nakamurella flavida]
MPVSTTVVGSLTAAYGVLELLKPDLLAKQTRMAGTHPIIARRLRTVGRVLGVRDVVSGSVLAAASTPRARRIATAARVVFDLGDGIVLASTLPAPAPKGKILAVTGGWAALSLLALVAAERLES